VGLEKLGKGLLQKSSLKRLEIGVILGFWKSLNYFIIYLDIR